MVYFESTLKYWFAIYKCFFQNVIEGCFTDLFNFGVIACSYKVQFCSM